MHSSLHLMCMFFFLPKESQVSNSSTLVGLSSLLEKLGYILSHPHPPVHNSCLAQCKVFEGMNFSDIHFDLGINTHRFGGYLNKLNKMGIFHGRNLNFGGYYNL